MNTLILLTFYTPYWTGLTQYARRLADGLTSRRFTVTVLTSRHERKLRLTESDNGVKIVRYPVLKRLSRTLLSIQVFLYLIRYIRENDTVIIFLPYAEVLYAAILSKLLGKRLFLIHNGDLVLPGGWVSRIIERIYFISTRMALYLCDRVVIQTEDYAVNSSLLAEFRHKWIEIIPPFPPQSKSGNGRLPEVRPGKYNVGFSGRFVAEKGFDRLYRAIPLILKKEPDTRFVYAGQTRMVYEHFFENNRDLIDKYNHVVTYLGKINQDRMRRFYRILDVLAVPSRTDCFPFVIAEAMLAGTPVVVSDIPGARASVKKTGMGELTNAADPKKLAAAIVRVIRNKKSYTKNLPAVRQLFSYEKSLDAFAALIGPGV